MICCCCSVAERKEGKDWLVEWIKSIGPLSRSEAVKQGTRLAETLALPLSAKNTLHAYGLKYGVKVPRYPEPSYLKNGVDF